MNDEGHKALRAPFPPEQIGLLPKGGRQLQFVGHADVTDRLLSVDPEWSWEPLGYTPEGLPALDRFGNLWIRLTVCNTTRIGVGDGGSMKECIGDALRNASMRFGVALDLWASGDRQFGIEGHDAPARRQIVGGENDRQAQKPDLRAQVIAACQPPKFASYPEFELAFESATGKTFADADDTALAAFLSQVAA